MVVKSPLRYPGGKSRAVKQILPLIPKDIKEYREPLIGGGSLFFAMRSLYPDIQYWINDLNYDLYCFWNQVRDNVDDLTDELFYIQSHTDNGRELFEHLSKDKDALDANKDMLSEYDRAMRYFILNRISFSGAVDSAGYSKSAYEHRFTKSSIQRVKNISPYLQNVKITNVDYSELLFATGNDIFIFLDPPYINATKSKLYGNRGILHTSFDHKQFAENMRECSHRWLITYDDSNELRSRFDFADIQSWELQYGMNNKKGNEMFIKNF